MQKSKKTRTNLDHIGIQNILIDHTEWVTLWGFILKDGKKINKDFLISFNQLNELLHLSGEEGSDIQMLIVEKIESGLEQPSIINLSEAFGQPVFFNHCILKVKPTWLQNEANQRIRTNCLFIEAVYPPESHKPQALTKHAQLRQSLIDCESQLAEDYALYLGYLELDFKEDAALKHAHLEDDLKFKMAYYAWKMKKDAA